MPIATDLSFGQWLKRRRRGAGLTQDELAQRVGYAVATIRKIEQDELRPSYQMADKLAEELDIAPEDRPAFIRFARDEGADTLPLPTQTAEFAPQAPRTASSNLPRPLTSLVGRDRELAAVRQLLRREEVCLVTLVGPGGTGKTRLSLQVAAELVDDFQDGVYFVNLVPIRDPNLVPSTIAQILGVKEQGGQPLFNNLKDYLRDKQMLLLLDNFEQVVVAAPIVAELLAACPRLKVLVTSREVLRVSGEHEYFVPPLAVPDINPLPAPEPLSQYASVKLFLQRAAAVKSDFAVTAENARAVAEICRRLDGLPLAIELAAARIKLFPPEALLTRLDSRLKLLTGGPRDLPSRQQTLRGAIDWSYDLLTEAEKQLFRRLAVFVGRRTLEAAAAVGDPNGDLLIDVMDGLASLVDKSLMRQVEGPDGEPRFTLLETIREYGLERLRESGEEQSIRRVHAAYYLRLVQEAERHFFGPGLATWLDRVETELNNIRSVLEWSLAAALPDGGQASEAMAAREAQRVEAGLAIAGLLWRFWVLRGHVTEGYTWLDSLLTKGSTLPASARYFALHTAGNLASDQGDYHRAKELYEECLALSQELGQRVIVTHMHNNLGNIAMMQGDYADAETLFEQALAGYHEWGHTWAMSMVLGNLGELARLRGDAQHATTLLEESLLMVREAKDDQRRAETLYTLGLVAYDQADFEAALMQLGEALHLYRAGGNKLGTAFTLDALGEVARSQADYARAVELYQQALTLQRELGDKRGIAYSLYGLGRVAHNQGDQARATVAFEEGLGLLQALGDKTGIAIGLEGSALVAASRDQPAQAARLFGRAQALREAIGFPVSPVDRPTYEVALAGVQVALGEARFAEELAEGRAMTIVRDMSRGRHPRGAGPGIRETTIS